MRDQEPLCGYPWLRRHQYQHTQAEIDALRLEVRVDGKNLPGVKSGTSKKHRKQVMGVVKSYGKE